jgi:hypothetical protein
MKKAKKKSLKKKKKTPAKKKAPVKKKKVAKKKKAHAKKTKKAFRKKPVQRKEGATLDLESIVGSNVSDAASWHKFDSDRKTREAFMGYLGKQFPNTCSIPIRFGIRVNYSGSIVKSGGTSNYEILKWGLDSFIIAFKKCTKSKKVRFVIQELLIWSRDHPGEAHANSLVYDVKNKILTRFEPHGGRASKHHTEINKLLHQMIKKAPFKGWKFVPPIAYCPYFGPQAREKKYLIDKRFPKQHIKDEIGGFCAAWSFMFMHLRILNPDKTDRQIIRIISRWDAKKVTNKIRLYANFIQKQAAVTNRK